MNRRNWFAMLVAEFLGTGVLTLAVLSVQRSQLQLTYFVAIAAGLAVALMTYIFSNISGGHLNPALTVALWTARRVRTVPAILYIAAQLLGAWAAYGLYHYFVHTDVQAITQAFTGRILVAEAIGTMVFALAWAAAAYNNYENSRFATLAGIGFTLAVIVASGASFGLVNPAVALGTRAWEVVGENGLMNYVVGPLLGAVIGVNLYGLLFAESDRRGFALLRSGRGREASVVTVTEASSLDEDDDLDEDLDTDTAGSVELPEEVIEKPAKKASTARKTKVATVASKSTATAAKPKKAAVKKVVKKRA